MRHPKTYTLIIAAIAVGVVVAFARILPAVFHEEEIKSYVEIDGVNYGAVDQIIGLEEIATPGVSTDFTKVVLKREFVSEPSLYAWAKNTMATRVGLKNIHIIKANSNGEEVSRYVLKLCQPLNWTVEAVDSEMGGFNETVAIAVQDVSLEAE